MSPRRQRRLFRFPCNVPTHAPQADIRQGNEGASDVKALSAAARGVGVWVVEIEPSADERGTVVQVEAKEVEQRLGVNHALDPLFCPVLSVILPRTRGHVVNGRQAREIVPRPRALVRPPGVVCELTTRATSTTGGPAGNVPPT